MTKQKKTLLALFLTFLKIGAFTFGGGYAMISVIENEVVSNKKWLSHDEMMDLTVVAESTPGPLAINTATFVGYKVAGFFGSAVSTLGVVLPSLFLLYVIAMFLENFLAITWVESAFRGIKAAVAFLIFAAGLKMFRKMKKNRLNWILFALAFLVIFLVKLDLLRFSSIYLILISAVVGLMLYGIRKIRRGGKKS